MNSALSPVGAPSISVLVPCRDERENIGPLLEEIDAALRGRTREIIVVDDGSSDGTGEAVRRAARTIEGVRLLRHAEWAGQSAALRTGLEVARGDIIVTLDGDGQNDPAFIPALISALEAGEPRTGLAAGQRVGRKAGLAKRYGSRIANSIRRSLLRDATRDTGCGLKALPRSLFLRLPYFDGWHRFLPALIGREGMRIAHVDVNDRPRRHGQSKYRLFDRLWIGILDVFGVWWLQRRRRLAQAHEEHLSGQT